MGHTEDIPGCLGHVVFVLIQVLWSEDIGILNDKRYALVLTFHGPRFTTTSE